MFGAQRRMNPKHCPTRRGHNAERASLDFKGTYLHRPGAENKVAGQSRTPAALAWRVRMESQPSRPTLATRLKRLCADPEAETPGLRSAGPNALA
jgi:hypothetical protein